MGTPLALSGAVPGIHVFLARDGKKIDGRDKPAPDRMVSARLLATD
jgi:hypothetical protein